MRSLGYLGLVLLAYDIHATRPCAAVGCCCLLKFYGISPVSIGDDSFATENANEYVMHIDMRDHLFLLWRDLTLVVNFALYIPFVLSCCWVKALKLRFCFSWYGFSIFHVLKLESQLYGRLYDCSMSKRISWTICTCFRMDLLRHIPNTQTFVCLFLCLEVHFWLYFDCALYGESGNQRHFFTIFVDCCCVFAIFAIHFARYEQLQLHSS